MSALLQAREKLGTGAAGLWALTRAVCYTAPYLASKTDLRGVCELDPATLTEPGDAVAPVDVFDTGGQKVFEARITMRLSPDPKKRAPQ